MYKCFLSSFLCLFLYASQLFSQGYTEIGGHIGLSNYSGDLSSSNIGPVVAQSHFSGGAFARYNFNANFSVRGGFNFATVSGKDALSGSARLEERNLNFSTNIYEGSLMLEMNVLKYLATISEYHFAPYVSAGIAVFSFDPTTDFEGSRIRLQPLGTEGQGTSFAPDNPKYNLTQFNIPFGGGFKMKLAEGITAHLELVFRWTFTDYLDDVSTVYPGDEILLSEGAGELAVLLSNRTGVPVEPGQVRGGATVNDYYATGVVGVSYAFTSLSKNNGAKKYRGSRRKNVKCPKF